MQVSPRKWRLSHADTTAMGDTSLSPSAGVPSPATSAPQRMEGDQRVPPPSLPTPADSHGAADTAVGVPAPDPRQGTAQAAGPTPSTAVGGGDTESHRVTADTSAMGAAGAGVETVAGVRTPSGGMVESSVAPQVAEPSAGQPRAAACGDSSSEPAALHSSATAPHGTGSAAAAAPATHMAAVAPPVAAAGVPQLADGSTVTRTHSPGHDCAASGGNVVMAPSVPITEAHGGATARYGTALLGAGGGGGLC